MNHILQIFTGQYSSSGPEYVSTVKILDEALNNIETEDIIIGWSSSTEVYSRILELVHQKGKRAWLWLPMFSELPENWGREPSWTINDEIQQGNSVMEGEDFTFVCPSSKNNINNPIEIYNHYFSHLPFDGIFLDKIRHNSFSNGIESALGCFCPRCKAKYMEQGIDIETIKKKIKSTPNVLLPEKYKAGRYYFADEDVNRFFACKADWITKAVNTVSNWFIKRGHQVGLDVYTPLLSYLVGQDIQDLSVNKAFIKPMMYRITKAPAGIPFELQSLQTAFEQIGVDSIPTFKKIWQSNDLYSNACTTRQIESIKAKCPIYPGFEINNISGICESNPDYITSNINLYKQINTGGVVLSWNLLGAPQANLQALYNIQSN